MTPEELGALPWGIACPIILSTMPPVVTNKLADIEAPRSPPCPKYDRKIFRKGGRHQWASETSLEGLRHWAGLAKESADGGGQYAEKDLKQYTELSYWIGWRIWNPTGRARMTRGDDENVVAEAPMDKPAVWSPLPKDEPESGDPDWENTAGGR